jgi:hypothetical protein
MSWREPGERPQRAIDQLAQRTNDELQRITRLFTSKPSPNKAGLTTTLVALASPPLLPSTLDLVGAEGRTLLAHAAHGNGLLRTAKAAAPGLDLGSWERGGYGRSTIPPSPVLIFFPDGEQLPSEYRTRLAKALPAPPAPPFEPMAGEPPGTIVPVDPLADAALILHLAKDGGLETSSKGLSAACLKRLAASAIGVSGDRRGDHLRLDNLAWHLGNGDLITTTAKGLRAKRTTIDHAVVRALFTAYAGSGIDEIDDIACLRGRSSPYAPWTDPRSRRKELLRTLRRCRPGAWYAIGDVLAVAAATAAVEPLLHTTELVRIGREYDGSMDNLGQAGLDLLRDAWVRMALFGYLAPLGVIEIAVGMTEVLPRAIRALVKDDDTVPTSLSPADTLTAMRLTPLGLWLLGLGPEPSAACGETGGWRIQADGTVIALGQRIGPQDRLLLDCVGERLDERSWRIERDSILTAIANGQTAATLRERLEALSGATFPDSLVRLFDEAHRRTTAIAIAGTVVLLTVSDRHAAEQLVQDRSTAALCRGLADGIIAVEPDDLKDLRRAARKLGWHIPLGGA